MSNRDFLTVDETAELLRVSKATIYDWIYKRLLPYRKHGSRVLFLKQDLMKWSSASEVNALSDSATEATLNRYKKVRPCGSKRLGKKSSLKTEITTTRPC